MRRSSIYILVKTTIILLSILVLSACGGGGGDDSSSKTPPSTLSGVFIDAKVQGLRYETATVSGLTNSEGEFKYRDGEDIEFFLGNLSLGLAKATELMTPYTLTGDTDLANPNAKTLNIALLLQNSDLNRSDTTRLDVSMLKEYKFSNVDLNSSNPAMESRITTLLNTPAFQTLIDNNNTLITTQQGKEHLTGNVKIPKSKPQLQSPIIANATNVVLEDEVFTTTLTNTGGDITECTSTPTLPKWINTKSYSTSLSNYWFSSSRPST